MTYLEMNYSAEICAFLVAGFCWLYGLQTRQRITRQYRLFRVLLADIMAAALLSLCSVVLSRHLAGREGALYLLTYALTLGYFLAHYVFFPMLGAYVLQICGASYRRNRKFYCCYFAPGAFSVLLIATNMLSHGIFWFDAQGGYHRGVLLPLLGLVGMFYYANNAVFLLRYRHGMSRGVFWSTLWVILLGAAGSVVQFLFPHFILELFGESLSLLGLMLLFENESAELDSTTGVYNRRAFVDINQRLIHSGCHYMIIRVDIKNLSMYQSIFSVSQLSGLLTQAGLWMDKTLQQVAPGAVYRVNGGNFAVITFDLPEAKEEAMVERIRERFRKVWQVGNSSALLQAVVEVVRVPEDVKSLESLLSQMQSVLPAAAYGTTLVTGRELDDIHRAARVEEALGRALRQHSLRVYFQPIWSARNNRIVSCEVLTRLIDDDLGFVPPDEFIPIAEKSGLITGIGYFALEEAARFLHDHREDYLGLTSVEVNLSLYQFFDTDLVRKFTDILSRYDVPASMINLEVTESGPNDMVDSAQQVLEQLRGKGFTLSLDDYGTGYSNMSRLLSGDYATVKIDKNMLHNAEKDRKTAYMLHSMVRMVREMGLNVVQEGVETKEQLTSIVRDGANLIQGYYFSRPVPADEFADYVRKYNHAEEDADRSNG